jgi:predicted nucleotidyltransferase
VAPRSTEDENVGMLDDVCLHELAERLTSVEGVVGVVLGGSRARGDHGPDSDVDLGLYYRPPLDVAALRALAQEVTGADVEVTEPGAWGPWVDGGAWLSLGGTAVDWIYRDLDRVRASAEDARAGRFEFHFQVGHPLGVPSFIYAGELALGVVLRDPSGELTALQRVVSTYPPALRRAAVGYLWEASFSLDNARKAVARADTTYIAGCLFRAVELCAHAVHAHQGRWLVNEKGAVASAGRLITAPADFTRRAQSIVAHLGDDPVDLRAAIAAASTLLDDVRAACEDSGS